MIALIQELLFISTFKNIHKFLLKLTCRKKNLHSLKHINGNNSGDESRVKKYLKNKMKKKSSILMLGNCIYNCFSFLENTFIGRRRKDAIII